MPQNNDDYMPGQSIGDYTVLEEIGRGGMGVVYLTQHQYLKKRFAVKVMPRQFSEKPEFANLFQREAQTLGNLKHENIVEVHNFGVHEGSQYLVMDYVEGGTIEDYRMKCGGKMPPNEVLATLYALMSGLQHAHSRNIIHRDLKPENLLLAQDGTVKISDFGLAQLMESELFLESSNDGSKPAGDTMVALYADSLKNEQFTGGTEGYMAPEVAEGGVGDKRADYYAVGVIAYYLLTGKTPTAHYKPATAWVKDLDKRWDALIARCLEPQIEARYQNAEALIQDLNSLTRKPRKKLYATMAAGAFLILLIVLVGLNASKNRAQPPESVVTQTSSTQSVDGEKDLPLKTKPKSEPNPPTSTPSQGASTAPSPALAPPSQREPQSTVSKTAPTRRKPLLNPSFESGLQGWNSEGASEVSVVRDSDNALHGTQLARILSTRSMGETTLFTTVNAQWGERLRASVWVRLRKQARMGSIEASLQLRGITHDGTILGQKTDSTNTTGEWQRLTLDINIPPPERWKSFEKVELRLIFKSELPIIAMGWFDNVFLEIITPEDPAYTQTLNFPEAPPRTRESADSQNQTLGIHTNNSPSESVSAPSPAITNPKQPQTPPLDIGMAELVLTVRDARGRELSPNEYTLSINGKPFSSLSGTNIYRFLANKEIGFTIAAEGHEVFYINKVFIPAGARAQASYQLISTRD